MDTSLSVPASPAGPQARPAAVPFLTGLLRGIRRRCPSCAGRTVFAGYLRTVERCPSCGLDVSALRADDAPPYFTIFLVGHIVIPGMLLLEQSVHPDAWVHMAVWLPTTLALTLGLLPFIKGAVIGAQWALFHKA